jgi:hypothetical protein
MLRALDSDQNCRTVFHDLATPHRAYLFPSKHMTFKDAQGPASRSKFAGIYSASIPWRLVSSLGINSPTFNRREIHGSSTTYLKPSPLKLSTSEWTHKSTVYQEPRPAIQNRPYSKLDNADANRCRDVEHKQWTASPFDESTPLLAGAAGRGASRLPGELAGPFHQLRGVRTAMAVNVLRTFEANLERTIKLCQPASSAIEPRSPAPRQSAGCPADLLSSQKAVHGQSPKSHSAGADNPARAVDRISAAIRPEPRAGAAPAATLRRARFGSPKRATRRHAWPGAEASLPAPRRAWPPRPLGSRRRRRRARSLSKVRLDRRDFPAPPTHAAPRSHSSAAAARGALDRINDELARRGERSASSLGFAPTRFPARPARAPARRTPVYTQRAPPRRG